MKNIIIITIISALFLGIGNSYAQIQTITKKQMKEQADLGEEIKKRKLYYTYESTYIPNNKDKALIKKINSKLLKLNKKSPNKLRKIYKIIDKKLEKLAKKYRNSKGEGVTKKGTRLYYLLEQINNIITDFPGNQDLGCVKNIAKGHMENNLCVSNTIFIKDETGVGTKSYDYIFNHKWGNIIMTNCNEGYSKEKSTYNKYPMVLCIKN